jgi:hypothetical protein
VKNNVIDFFYFLIYYVYRPRPRTRRVKTFEGISSGRGIERFPASLSVGALLVMRGACPEPARNLCNEGNPIEPGRTG